jgi:hypothetical protein
MARPAPDVSGLATSGRIARIGSSVMPIKGMDILKKIVDFEMLFSNNPRKNILLLAMEIKELISFLLSVI